MAHVAQWKKDTVAGLKDIIRNSNVVAVVGIHGIAAPQMQQIRSGLRDKMTIKGIKNRLLGIAIDDLDMENIGELRDFIEGQTAIIASDVNPFKLYRMLNQRRTEAPAKGGDVAPKDIAVEKGPTPFKPGPIISDLQRAGFPATIDKGRVVFKRGKVIVKEGEVISNNVASLLTQLEIYPMEVGLDPKVIYEDGDTFLPSTLDIDSDAFAADVGFAARNAFDLAISMGYITDVTVLPLVQKAYGDALSLAVSRAVVSRDTVSHILSKAHGEMLSVASMVPSEGLDADLRGIIDGRAAVSSEERGGEGPSEGMEDEEQTETEEEEEEGEDEEEEKEEEAVSGLGALFG